MIRHNALGVSGYLAVLHFPVLFLTGHDIWRRESTGMIGFGLTLTIL